MGKRKRKKALTIIGVVAAVLLTLQLILFAADHSSTATREDTFTVGTAPRLAVANEAGGRINVRSGDAGAVRVEASQRGAWRLKYRVHQSGDTIAVSVRTRGLLGWFGGNQQADVNVGKVAVKLLGTPSVKVDAATDNGTISTKLPVVVTGTASRKLSGTMRTAAAELVVRTDNGKVTIE